MEFSRIWKDYVERKALLSTFKRFIRLNRFSVYFHQVDILRRKFYLLQWFYFCERYEYEPLQEITKILLSHCMRIIELDHYEHCTLNIGIDAIT